MWATQSSNDLMWGCQPLGSVLQFPFPATPPGGGLNPSGPTNTPQVPCPIVPTGKVVFGVPTAPLVCDRAAACSSSMPVATMLRS